MLLKNKTRKIGWPLYIKCALHLPKESPLYVEKLNIHGWLTLSFSFQQMRLSHLSSSHICILRSAHKSFNGNKNDRLKYTLLEDGCFVTRYFNTVLLSMYGVVTNGNIVQSDSFCENVLIGTLDSLIKICSKIDVVLLCHFYYLCLSSSGMKL